MPMFFAALLKLGQGNELDYKSLLGGTELYILSVTVLAATKNDLDNSDADFSDFRGFNIMTEALFLLIIFIGVMFAAVYINRHVQDFGLDSTFISNFGIALGILTGAICTSLQAMLNIAERRKETD
jgi:hypothetical protein